MKKLISVLLALTMLFACASAEETVRVHEMMLEGMAEQVTETLYKSDAGYTIWYPSDYVTPGEQYGRPCFYPADAGEESGVYFLIIPSDANPADAEALLAEAVGGFGPEATVSEAQWTATESGALLGSVQADDAGVIYRYYLVTDDETMLMITSCFPAEAAEGFGVRFDRMAQTISFDKVELSGRHEGEGYAISYPSELLACTEVLTHDGFIPAGDTEPAGTYLMIVKSDVAPEHIDSMLQEAVGGYEGNYAVTEGEEKALANGMTLDWIQAEQDGKIDRYYIITDGDAVYCLTASFPAAEVDYGAAFDAMAEAFEIVE